MPDGHRDQPQRPHQAQREDCQHHEWPPEPSEREAQHPEREEMASEDAGELSVRAFEEAHQPRGRDERLDEFLMIEDLLPELPERCGRQIQQSPPTEVIECNTVCEVIEGDGTSLELADEPRRKGLRLPECPASDRDDDLVELAEVLGVVTIAGHVWLARRQEVKLRGLEAESR